MWWANELTGPLIMQCWKDTGLPGKRHKWVPAPLTALQKLKGKEGCDHV